MTKFFVTRGLFLLLIGAFLFSAVWAQEGKATELIILDLYSQMYSIIQTALPILATLTCTSMKVNCRIGST